MEMMDAILQWLQPLAEAYLGQFGWAVAIVSWVGTFRLIFKPLMSMVRQYIKDSESKKDDAFLEKLDAHWAFKSFVFLIDLIASVKLKPIKTTEVFIVQTKGSDPTHEETK